MVSECSALVVFGVTGDLVRKEVFASLYELALVDRLDMPVIGVGRSDWTSETLRKAAETAIRAHAADDLVDCALRTVVDRLSYVQGDYTSPDLYETLTKVVVDHELVLCYLAVPPTVFPAVVRGLAATDIRTRARLLIEKPLCASQILPRL